MKLIYFDAYTVVLARHEQNPQADFWGRGKKSKLALEFFWLDFFFFLDSVRSQSYLFFFFERMSPKPLCNEQETNIIIF